MYFVYILHSASKNKYYIGCCQNIDERLKKHNTNHGGFTGRCADWIIKWKEEVVDKSSALRRERQIKNWRVEQ